MTVAVLQTTDIVGGSYSLGLLGLIADTILLLLGTGWVPDRWKLSVGLSSIVGLVAAVAAFEAREVWLATRQAPIVYAYLAWMITMPVQIVTLYFVVATAERPSVALFWRLLVVTAAMVLVRYMGEAGLTNAALSFLIGIVCWLYILGELFFGQMNEIVTRTEDEALRRGYFWLRLIVTIGWAIYPLGNFIGSFGGGVDGGSLALTYNLADFVNRIAFGLAIFAVAMRAATLGLRRPNDPVRRPDR